jgi:peptidoglycan/xylan/chitin deacetylase (PgdA/CDA1 family)
VIERFPLLAWPGPGRPLLTTMIYHRVLPKPDPMRPGEVDAATFDRQMRFLSRSFAVLPLADAVQRLHNGTLPRRACCVTFDDGYADNLTVALPILEKYRLPATVFVATGYLDGGCMFNDAIISIVDGHGDDTLDLSEEGLDRYSTVNLAARHATVAALLNHLKYLPPGEREACVSRIAARASARVPTDLMLSSSQLKELAARGVDIGGHTVAHTVLTTLDDPRAEHEIAAGKAFLENLLDRPVRTFAYPNGRPGRDYAEKHAHMLRKQGFEAAVTTAFGVANPATDRYQLPRFSPWGQSTLMLAARLTRNARSGCPMAECHDARSGAPA